MHFSTVKMKKKLIDSGVHYNVVADFADCTVETVNHQLNGRYKLSAKLVTTVAELTNSDVNEFVVEMESEKEKKNMKPVMTIWEFSNYVPYTYQTLVKCAKKTVDDGEGLPPLDAYKDRAGKWLVTKEAAEDWLERNKA